MSTPVSKYNERTNALRLAGEADTDPRTCARAIREGLDTIRTRSLRDRIAFAARRLGIQLGTAPEAT